MNHKRKPFNELQVKEWQENFEEIKHRTKVTVRNTDAQDVLEFINARHFKGQTIYVSYTLSDRQEKGHFVKKCYLIKQISNLPSVFGKSTVGCLDQIKLDSIL